MKYPRLTKADTALSIAIHGAIVLGTLYVAAAFAIGQYKHPLFFLSAHLNIAVDGINPFELFATEPTFRKDGFFVLLSWPLYKISGVGLFVWMGVGAQVLGMHLTRLGNPEGKT